MARPMKQGIDYYSLDVDFLRDIKIRKIRRACGPQSIEILLCLLGNIYRDNGYYIGWDEDSVFLVADEVGAKEGLVNEVVDKAVKVGFFNQEKFYQYQILTSNGIQERFKEATSKRKGVKLNKQYLVNDDNNPSSSVVNGGNNPASDVVNGVDNQQSKVKESKVKESKVNHNNPREELLLSGEKSIQESWEQNGFGFLAPKTRQDFEYWISDFQEIGSSTQEAVELINKAISIAVDANARKYGYVRAILQNWKTSKFSNVGMVDADSKGRSSKAKQFQNFEQNDDQYNDLPF